jgi:LuxR family transcriptional regulator, quorum-sensing system regulator CciR
MQTFELIQSFTEVAQKVQRIEDLKTATADAVFELGYDYFAILHHLDLEIDAPGLVRFTNYPDALVADQLREKRYADDPVLQASLRSPRGFLWSEVPKLIELNARQKATLALGARAGLGDGYTVPIHVPGEFAGSCSFGVKAGRAISRQSTAWLHYVGGFAFEAGRRIARARLGRVRPRVRLSGRQMDCLVLMARGASAREAANKLGIKQDTVQKHIVEAKARAGVRSMSQLVVRSLFDGAVTFNDLLDEKRN